MVTFIEVLGFLLLLIIFGGVTYVAELINAIDGDLLFSFDIFFGIIAIFVLFSSFVRDLIDDIYDDKAWFGYIMNIVYIIVNILNYAFFTYKLSGTIRFVASIMLVVSLLFYVGNMFLSRVYANMIGYKSGVTQIKHIVIVTFVQLLVSFMLVYTVSVGATITKNTITVKENIAYYIVNQDTYIYNETCGYAKSFLSTKRPIDGNKILGETKLYPAENNNSQQLNYYYETFWIGDEKSIDYTPVFTENGEFGYVESYTIDKYYYSEETRPELIFQKKTVAAEHYPYLPWFIVRICEKIYCFFSFDDITFAK